MTVREKRTTIYISYCAIVVLLVIVVALIYRPHSTPVATHTHVTTQHHPAGSSAGKSGSTPLAVNGNGKGEQHITGVSTAPSSSAVATSAPLSNSGPGNVIGLFALVSVLGSLAWRRKLIRSVIR